LWGGNDTIADYLYGGDGADTFIAGDGEGNAYIYDYSDDDVVCLHNVNAADIESITLNNAGTDSENLMLSTANTNFYIQYDTDTVSTTTVVYADGTRTQYDHSNGTWSTLQSSSALDELWGGGDAVDDLIRAEADDDPLASVLNVESNVALNEINPISTAGNLGDNSLLMSYANDLLRRRSNR
ncbi:MAG: hypothetical protein IJU71_11160, partial [Selenomonadaceae bacterium]|nr:hypothetical protein [Selenomonadaceae bacterium]